MEFFCNETIDFDSILFEPFAPDCPLSPLLECERTLTPAPAELLLPALLTGEPERAPSPPSYLLPPPAFSVVNNPAALSCTPLGPPPAPMAPLFAPQSTPTILARSVRRVTDEAVMSTYGPIRDSERSRFRTYTAEEGMSYTLRTMRRLIAKFKRSPNARVPTWARVLSLLLFNSVSYGQQVAMTRIAIDLACGPLAFYYCCKFASGTRGWDSNGSRHLFTVDATRNALQISEPFYACMTDRVRTELGLSMLHTARMDERDAPKLMSPTEVYPDV
jgi:hypothetical protein